MAPVCARYQSYLLRLWRDDAGDLLHASLQSTENGLVFHLKDLDELLAFLSAKQTASVSHEKIRQVEDM